MNDPSEQSHRAHARKASNEEFVKRLHARRPSAKPQFERVMAEAAAKSAAIPEVELTGGLRAEAPRGVRPTATEMVLETIVLRERPVLFVKNDWIDTSDALIEGEEAKALVDSLDAKRATMQPLMPLIGRIDVVGFPGNDFLGTGWFVETDVVVTNRHVASLIARRDGRNFVFSRGVGGKPISSSVSTLHEFDDLAVDTKRVFAVKEVLYVEPESGPDIAFLKVTRRSDGTKPNRIPVAKTDVGDDVPVFVVGYPARASKNVIPDQQLMKELYRDRYDVKRAAPGYTMGTEAGTTRHDCTTLGGNSGSVVMNLATGEAVGLHFAGLYQETNYAVRASVLWDYVNRKRWSVPVVGHEKPSEAPPRSKLDVQRSGNRDRQSCLDTNGAVTVTIPLSITIGLGQPIAGSARMLTVNTAAKFSRRVSDSGADLETAARAFWKARPDGVIAVRVGFDDEGGVIGDMPFLAASVPASQLDEVESHGPASFEGLEIRYVPAEIGEQIEASPALESVDQIAYDDDARTGEKFSFDPVDEQMTVRAHVGPEYSWDELKAFLAGANESLVSAMYEFHAPQIKDAIEDRLDAGTKLSLVLDNATFSKVQDNDVEFDRIRVFGQWKKKYDDRFKRIVAPEGTSGLISDSYHIKVTVREDDTFWLSSGNWKKESSQPVISQAERDDVPDSDLPGNREWHVVIENATLARRFRSHILQDFKRSRDLGGGELPKSRESADPWVDVPIEEGIELERRPPSRVVKPRSFQGSIKVKPLLTPDREGAVYSDAVLALIRSAKKSLLFQIPYIGMPSDPTADRGYIDDLIEALTRKLKSLDDARVILRAGGSRFSSPTHTAWYFKSKGVDIGERLRSIENHHTKGMIVDGKRVLLGSHNWSKPGVTLNRDASLLFDDEGLAGYYAEAFEIDWARSNPIRPRRYVKDEGVLREAVGTQPRPGFRRVRLSELIEGHD